MNVNDSFSNSQQVNTFPAVNAQSAKQIDKKEAGALKPTELSPEVVQAQKKFNDACVATITTENSSFSKLSSSLIGDRLCQDKDIDAEIQKFKNCYAEPIKAMQDGKTWMQRKSELGDKMQTEKSLTIKIPDPELKNPDGTPVITEKRISFEEFRTAAKDFQVRVANLAASKLGICQFDGVIFGTTGYDSDIDLVIVPKGPESQRNLMILKTIIDCTWTHTMGGLSGVQADLEVYLESPGLSLKTEERVAGNQAGKEGFSRVELTMAFVELRRSYGSDTEGWENRKTELKKVFSESLGSAGLADIFKTVDDFEKTLAKDIMKQAVKEGDTSPGGLRKAAAVYKANRLVTLSTQVDKVLNDLQIERRKPNQFEPSVINKIAELEVRAAALEGVRYAMFDEAYLTQSAYIKTCEARGGQKDKAGIRLSEGGSRLPATQFQYVIAGLEDSYKFNIKVQKKMANETNLSKLQHAVVDSSKYANRITSSAQAFLENVARMDEGALSALGIKKEYVDTLLRRATDLNDQTVELEKCKRKVILNEVTFVTKMEQAIGFGKVTNVQLKKLALVFDQNVKLPAQEKYNLATEHLKRIDARLVGSRDVDTIMKARAGFDRMLKENEGLTALHVDSEDITLQKFGLVSKTAIDAYNASINELQNEALILSNRLQIVAAPKVLLENTEEFRMFNLTGLWQAAAPIPPPSSQRFSPPSSPKKAASAKPAEAPTPVATAKPLSNDALVSAARHRAQLASSR